MKGWLVVSEDLKNNDRFLINHNLLIESATKINIELQKIGNAELLCYCGKSKSDSKKHDTDFVLFYDKDITLAMHLENLGYRLFNTAKAIELCDDKALTAMELSKNGFSIPETVVVPKTYHSGCSKDWIGRFCEKALDIVGGFPVIVKERFGSFGEYQTNKRITDFEILTKEISARLPSPMIIQKYIEGNGYDLRIHVIGDSIVSAIKRNYSGDAGGFSFWANQSGYIPTEEEKQLAISSSEKLMLDFSGVDLLIDRNGKPYVCEVNSNALFQNVLYATGISIADHMMKYIYQKRILERRLAK